MELQGRLGEIARRYGIRDVYVFGSRAVEIASRVRGENFDNASSPSDVDIAVQPRAGRNLDVHDRVRLGIELEDLFEAPRVDLVVLSEARPWLAVEVLRGEVLFTDDDLAQAEHELYILRRAADLAHMRRERIEQILTEGGR